jgi:hypothetical protein
MSQVIGLTRHFEFVLSSALRYHIADKTAAGTVITFTASWIDFTDSIYKIAIFRLSEYFSFEAMVGAGLIYSVIYFSVFIKHFEGIDDQPKSDFLIFEPKELKIKTA